MNLLVDGLCVPLCVARAVVRGFAGLWELKLCHPRVGRQASARLSPRPGWIRSKTWPEHWVIVRWRAIPLRTSNRGARRGHSWPAGVDVLRWQRQRGKWWLYSVPLG